MKINKKIVAATKFNPTKMSHQLSVTDICQKIDNRTITLPLYQRDISWTLKKSVDLFNYQLFGKAPISPISINKITNNTTAVEQICFLDRELIPLNEITNDQQSVVDGQQRLSTSYKAFIGSDDFRNIVLDLSKAKFTLTQGAISLSQIPVGILLNKDVDLLKKYLNEKNTVNDYYMVLLDVRSKMLGYNYTLNIAENLSEEEQIEWFEVLNNAGSRVSSLQMNLSKLKLKNFDIYVEYVTPFKEKVSEYGLDKYFTPFTTNVSYPISSLNPAYEVIIDKCNISNHKFNYAPFPSDSKASQLNKLTLSELRNLISLSLESLEKSLIFITDENLENNIDRLDYILFLSGFFTFNTNVLELKQKNRLIKWVQDTSFTNMSNGSRRDCFQHLIEL